MLRAFVFECFSSGCFFGLGVQGSTINHTPTICVRDTRVTKPSKVGFARRRYGSKLRTTSGSEFIQDLGLEECMGYRVALCLGAA